jgi:hypothetical protein
MPNFDTSDKLPIDVGTDGRALYALTANLDTIKPKEPVLARGPDRDDE